MIVQIYSIIMFLSAGNTMQKKLKEIFYKGITQFKMNYSCCLKIQS
jgi:hypothetical protein